MFSRRHDETKALRSSQVEPQMDKYGSKGRLSVILLHFFFLFVIFMYVYNNASNVICFNLLLVRLRYIILYVMCVLYYIIIFELYNIYNIN